MADHVAVEMLNVIRLSDEGGRVQDAMETLLGIMPTLDSRTIDHVIVEMTNIIRLSDEPGRRRIAQQVLIAFKNCT